MERWQGKVAIVTGASEGIGAAITKRLALDGMRVLGVARRPEKITEWASEIKGIKGEIHALKCDVTSDEEVRAAVKWAQEHLGNIHVLVNNAGYCPLTFLRDGSTESMRQMLEVNVLGLSMFTREVVQSMRTNNIDDGHIIHINSDSGQFILDTPGFDFYAGTKHAVRVMTEGLRKELRDLGTRIRVSSISPGLVKTNVFINCGHGQAAQDEMFEKCSYLEPEDIAEALVYALGAPPHVQVHEVTVRPTCDAFQ